MPTFVPRISLHHPALAAAMLAVLILNPARLSPAKTFVVSAPSAVQDVTLRDREFGQWNFGGGHLLEVGFMPGLYELHHGVSLIRFNLSQLPCKKVSSAKLRLYKPKCYIQMIPVKVSAYAVSNANFEWTEGSSLCAEEYSASTWKCRGSGQPWAGSEGCSKARVDYTLPALDTQIAPSDCGRWLEFTIPPSLIQSWLDDPDNNAGLHIKASDDAQLGEHAFFYSSEHHSGKGPQLVIDGTAGAPASPVNKRPFNPRYVFPPADDAFERWLNEADNRYTGWAKNPQMNMSRRQALMIYYFDVTVRGELLCPRVRIPLTQNMLELDDLIAQADASAVREKLKDVGKYLLIWEYIRETHWYDSGPLADVLSPLQIGILWAKPGYGIFAKMNDGRWDPLTPEQLEENILKTIAQMTSTLNLTAEQLQFIEPMIRRNETREHYYINKLRQSLDEIYPLIAAGNDGPEMFDCVKRLHYNHELFLYYQSTFSIPRWTVYMDHADPIALARAYQRVRREEYNPQRTGRQIEHAKRYGR